MACACCRRQNIMMAVIEWTKKHKMLFLPSFFFLFLFFSLSLRARLLPQPIIPTHGRLVYWSGVENKARAVQVRLG